MYLNLYLVQYSDSILLYCKDIEPIVLIQVNRRGSGHVCALLKRQARNWSEIPGLISPFGNTHRSVEPASGGYTAAAKNASATKPTINTPPKNENSGIGSRVEDLISTFRHPRKDSQPIFGYEYFRERVQDTLQRSFPYNNTQLIRDQPTYEFKSAADNSSSQVHEDVDLRFQQGPGSGYSIFVMEEWDRRSR
ncbi:hypothetical protein AYI69_g3391 [Smittium culicis]|uniref:Uncharacterized protein n=1 Tax=Smittium culicis TaxID=133412 RepID=A0A1R1YJT6_9FUNG|nr:hypothetical protein AYI69_g3391 [Smittium culicis]